MSTFHLVRLPVSLPALARWAASRNYGWTTRRDRKGREFDAAFDEGRAIHHLLVETFGPGILQPFRLFVEPRRHQGNIYAYSQADGPMLRGTARACALPEVTGILDLSQLESKAMPDEWRAGRRIGFEIRVKPISRLMKPLPDSDGGTFAKGAEMDVFLLEALRRFPKSTLAEESMLRAGRSRRCVYSDWLAARLNGAATLAEGTILSHFLRRRVARKGAAPEGPDATLQGNLIVADPLRFKEVLEQGVGRHKAYGYGMMLLRPPGRG